MGLGRNTRNLFSDIQKFVLLKRAIRKNAGTADWDRFNLRADYVGRIYTVFNPLPEDKGDSPDVLQIKLGERMIPCHKYIDSIGLSEIVGVSGEVIPDSESYLVVYYPIYKYISLWKLLKNTIIITLLLLFKNYIISGINWLLTFWPW